ncbi:Transcription initiation factor TFIID subunit 12 [Euphorbia peplus]|nr:Transcription initiation factor TFIID subunit 12 [Euphorbia peplus]
MDNNVPTTSAAATPIPPLPEPSPSPSPAPSLPAPSPSLPPQQQPSQPPSSAAAPPNPSPSPNPNPNPNPSLRPPGQPQSQPPNRMPTTFSRSWQHPHPHSPHFPQFNSIASSPSASSGPGPAMSSSATHSVAAPQQRVGVAIGVPAPHPSPSPSPFSSSFGQQYAGLGRGTINMPDSVPNSSSSQVRGVQGMGMVGSMNSNSTIRPGGIPAHHQQRPLQSSIRPNMPSPNNHSSGTQNFQGHGFMRPSSIGSSGSLGPNASQSTQSATQPWLPAASQGKKPVPSPSFRPQMNTPSLQQRSHPQRHHSLPTSQQQQHHMSLAQQQQPMTSHQPAEHYGQQFPPVRPPRSITEQLLQASANSKQPPAPTLLSNPVQPVTQSKIVINIETEEPCNRILSKRSIHDLVSQIDPSEKLDPEVEDILVDIADDFVESITAFGCSLAKHRKSETLEAKDILLHLERNWNLSLPGFSSDEIKTFRKPLINDVHKERLAAIKKSILASEIAGAKITGGQGAGSAKSNMAKTPANAMIGSNVKIREVT